MAPTGFPGVDWWTLFGGIVWSVICVTAAYLVVWVFAQFVLAFLHLTGRG